MRHQRLFLILGGPLRAQWRGKGTLRLGATSHPIISHLQCKTMNSQKLPLEVAFLILSKRSLLPNLSI